MKLICDRCGNEFELEPDITFLGDLKSVLTNSPQECRPFTKLDALCAVCFPLALEDEASLSSRGTIEH